MTPLAKHRTAFSVAAAILILLFATAAIFWARGFKPNIKKGRIDRTGLIVANSTPTGAQVYLDDRLTSATNTSIAFLDPKKYKIRIQKDGYTTWEKEIDVKADLATEIKALLFPLAPEIKPLTITGAANPALSPDGTKIVYGVSGQRGGLYLLTMPDRPFPFRQEPRLLTKNLAAFDFSKSRFLWNPNSKEFIASFENEEGVNTANLLVDSDKTDQEPPDITGSLNSTISGWQEELNFTAQNLALAAPENVKNATEGAQIQSSASPTPLPTNLISQNTTLVNYFPTGLLFSPDEEKIFYSPRGEAGKNKEGKYLVYDLKAKKEYIMPEFTDLVNISWFPDSNHLVIAQKGLISIIEADGTNKITVYSGKFENGFVFAHPSATRLIILTSLTQTEGNPPNLYSINLK